MSRVLGKYTRFQLIRVLAKCARQASHSSHHDAEPLVSELLMLQLRHAVPYKCYHLSLRPEVNIIYFLLNGVTTCRPVADDIYTWTLNVTLTCFAIWWQTPCHEIDKLCFHHVCISRRCLLIKKTMLSWHGMGVDTSRPAFNCMVPNRPSIIT